MREHVAQRAVEALLAAIESRDLRRVRAALSPDVTWQNVPHPVTEGRDAVVELLGGSLNWSTKVRWDVLTASYGEDFGILERVDRFWLDGEEYGAPCNGVFTVDVEASTVRSVRDYVDLGEWRARTAPVIERLRTRPAVDVVQRHVDAVRRRDVLAMAADYAVTAELVRGDQTYRGWDAIADYFDTVPERLSAQQLEFGPVNAESAEQPSVSWSIVDGGRTVTSGTDTFTVDAGRITRQIVRLDASDF